MADFSAINLKFELDAACRIVGELADLIRPACERLEIAGSIRRGSPMVKDADLVVIPDTHVTATHLLAWLDGMVERGIVKKALYGEKQTTRWGPKLRGMIFQGLQVEIDVTNEFSWGYKKWLRSGPAEANEFIMKYLIWKRALLRFIDGDGWYSPSNAWTKPKDKWIAADRQRLHIPDEDTLFALLGMPYLPPGERSEQRYKQLTDWNRQHSFPSYERFVIKAPVQPRLVNTAVPVDLSKKKEPVSNRISPLSVNEANADAWARQVYQAAITRHESQLAYFRLMGSTYPSYARRAEVMEQEIVMMKRMAGM